MRNLFFIKSLATLLIATSIASCDTEKIDALKGILEDVKLKFDTTDTDDTTEIKGLAADGKSEIVVMFPADKSNPATKISISSDVDWGVVTGDETIESIDGEDVYIFTLTSEEELPEALSTTDVAYVNYTIEATFADGSTKSATKAVAVVRPVVIFAHGMASYPETFDPMLNYIKPMGLFVDEALYALDYEATSLASYQTNNRVIPEAIDTTFAAMKEAGYVAAKATLIGHSMGGILTRIYMQDGVFESDGVTQKEPYRDDILKVITIDTPHSGSQLADFALELGESVSILSILSKFGAIVDLAVESEATASLNDATKLATANALKIPTHILTAEIGTLSGIVELVKNQQYVMAVLSFLLDAITSEFFYGDDTSDIIVPMKSQKGGVSNTLLKTYVTTYENEWHSSVHTTEQAADDVVALLDTIGSNDKTFTTGGFSPEVLSYTEILSSVNGSSRILIEEVQSIPYDGILNSMSIYLDSNDDIVAITYEGVDIGDSDESTATTCIEIARIEDTADGRPHIICMKSDMN